VDKRGLEPSLVFFFHLFQVQRYEGASTLYGPHTLTIYLSQYRNLSAALVKVSVMRIMMIASVVDTAFPRFILNRKGGGGYILT
jgi:hypothetical protein